VLFFKPFPGATGCFMGKERGALKEQGWGLEDLFLLDQVHGDQVVILKNAGEDKGGNKKKADAIINKVPGRPIAVKTADCVPILFAHPRGLIGAVHAGWRGSGEEILKKTLEVAVREFQIKAHEIQIAIGPTICREHYEVGAEVAGKFPQESYPGVLKPFGEKFLLDLQRVNFFQALKAGILEKNIRIFSPCTFEYSEWYSYRRSLKEGNQEAGRNYSWIVFR
jgi:YfiH family protein